MNKRDIEKIERFHKSKKYWISIIVCAVLFALFSVIMSHTLRQPQFTIYQNECRNETEVVECVIINKTYINAKYINVTYVCPSFYIEASSNITKVSSQQVCEQKEVQKVGLSEAWHICWEENISEEDFVKCSTLLDKNVIGNDFKYWLDENCECLECRDSRETIANKRQENKIICKYSLCLRYSCGDYTVKVKK